MWIELDLCDGWVGLIFFDPPLWVKSKNPLNPTQSDSCTPLQMIISIVYGPPCKKRKYEFLEALHQTASLFCCPWLCLGDFNVVFLQVDKRHGRPLNTTSTNG